MSAPQIYIGRFAPSPTGVLHMGSLVAAMASYLDAKAHHGQWLVRIEDLDVDRNVNGADEAILHSLQRCGMQWDGDITWQSQRTHLYAAAMQQLAAYSYPCGCSRKEIADSYLRRGAPASQIYPGTCRDGLLSDRQPRSWRLRVPLSPPELITFNDRLLGDGLQQNLTQEVGDFVLRRGDGFWAYQLAVVVDDAAQGITDIVRGADLLDSTARQIYLQRLLGLASTRYLHVPVVTNEDGEKLSKQTGAHGFDTEGSEQDLLRSALQPAARWLGLALPGTDSINEFWQVATEAWRVKLGI